MCNTLFMLVYIWTLLMFDVCALYIFIFPPLHWNCCTTVFPLDKCTSVSFTLHTAIRWNSWSMKHLSKMLVGWVVIPRYHNDVIPVIVMTLSLAASLLGDIEFCLLFALKTIKLWVPHTEMSHAVSSLCSNLIWSLLAMIKAEVRLEMLGPLAPVWQRPSVYPAGHQNAALTQLHAVVSPQVYSPEWTATCKATNQPLPVGQINKCMQRDWTTKYVCYSNQLLRVWFSSNKHNTATCFQ